jgi:DNA-binding PadR family transcriptional regulator
MTRPPLREPTFLVLTALAGAAQHGYGVMEDVARLSGGRVRLATGTLYDVLDRLRRGGLVEVDHEEVVASRLRRYYRLTGEGSQTQAAEAARRDLPTGPAAPTELTDPTEFTDPTGFTDPAELVDPAEPTDSTE